MNLILLFKNDFIDGKTRVRLNDRRFVHVRDVHKVRVGDELRVGLCAGAMGRGKIISMTDRGLEMEIHLNEPAPDPLPVTLVLALPRPLMCNRILAAVSAMGVKRIFLIQTQRVEKSFWKSPVLNADNLHKQLVLGLEQARDTILPEVQLRKKFKQFVGQELGEIAEGCLRLVAHPSAANSCPHDVRRPVTLIIGPEGGFMPDELDQIVEAGFQPVHLGKRILRVETAVPVLISKLF